MFGLLVLGFWLILGVYGVWFFFKADTFQPLTLEDLALTWRLHKQQRGCNKSHIHSLITNKNDVVGFKCDCGYEFMQKRLITQKTHKYPKKHVQSLKAFKGANQLPIARDSL